VIPRRPRRGTTALAALAAGVAAAIAAPQSPGPHPSETCPEAAGFPTSERCGLAALETRLGGFVDPASISSTLMTLASVPRVAGSADGERMASYVEEEFRKSGLRTTRATYEVLLPYPIRVSLQRTFPTPAPIPTDEKGLESDEPSQNAEIPIPYLAFSPSGEAEGELVYANYGLPEDYDALASAGVEVRGRIVVARYGKVFRGEKVRLAAEKGAIACILYSDPGDDGFTRGDVIPKGPWRPWGGVQRGSILNFTGDPLTPGWASTEGARRIDVAAANLPSIPALPLSYASASLLLDGLAGPAAPAGWQGGLPFTYHLGPGPVRARMSLEMEFARRRIHDIIAEIPGTSEPDHLVILGAHRDSWGPGASDNGGGTAALLEVGRALAALAREGWKPRRTLLLASWDAEEFGLMGSTEWVEDNESRLGGAVAYLNVDGAASGKKFEAAATPELAGLFRDVAGAIPDPDGDGTLLAAWRRQSKAKAGDSPSIGLPGGGSDTAPFQFHLGVPSGGHGFSGEGSGAYHSCLDTWKYVGTFMDPGFIHHAVTARFWAAAALRSASAAVLPLDFAATIEEVASSLEGIRKSALPGRSTVEENTGAALAEAKKAIQAAARLNSAEVRALEATTPPDPSALAAINGILIEASRSFVSVEGLPGDPWNRSLIFARSGSNGYAAERLPGLRGALESGESSLAARQADRLSEAAKRLARTLNEAAKRLRRL